LVVLITGVVDTGGKFAATDTPIKVNLGKDVTTGVVDTGGKFAATVNDSNGQLAVGVIDTQVVHLELRIFSKKSMWR
jgi:hypothetical protein